MRNECFRHTTHSPSTVERAQAIGSDYSLGDKQIEKGEVEKESESHSCTASSRTYRSRFVGLGMK